MRSLLTLVLGAAVLITAERWAVGPILLDLGGGHGVHVSDVAAALVAAPPAALLWCRRAAARS